MSTQNVENLRLVFKEQWWCVSAFSIMSGEEVKKKVEQLHKYVEEKLSSYKIEEINTFFVPNEDDRKNIIFIANNVIVDTRWINYIDNFDYSDGTRLYKTIGFILIRVRIKKEALNKIAITEIRPNYMQQLVMRMWGTLSKDFSDFFKFDDATPPYIFSVCTGYVPEKPYIPWSQQTAQIYRKELGQWAEVYSGQFPDYREQLYNNRVAVDLSNRTSEMHLILRNSALIYMDLDNYNKAFIKDNDTPNSTGYIYEFMISTILRIRTIAFAMFVVNAQLDKDTKNLLNKEYISRDLTLIKEDLDKSDRLKIILQTMLAPFFTDISRSNRQHYTSVLNRSVELFDIMNLWKMINDKIDSNVRELNSIFMDKQQDAADRQEKSLTILNFIIGASVLFSIIEYLVLFPPAQEILLWFTALFILLFLVVFIVRMKFINKE